jgi:hypothetical protein
MRRPVSIGFFIAFAKHLQQCITPKRPQEGHDSGYTVRDRAVILSLFLKRNDERREITFVDLIEVLFSAGLAESVQHKGVRQLSLMRSGRFNIVQVNRDCVVDFDSLRRRFRFGRHIRSVQVGDGQRLPPSFSVDGVAQAKDSALSVKFSSCWVSYSVRLPLTVSRIQRLTVMISPSEPNTEN